VRPPPRSRQKPPLTVNAVMHRANIDRTARWSTSHCRSAQAVDRTQYCWALKNAPC
jgi:hypothetical protein